MADKIKITIEDIEGDLLELPDGWVVLKVKTKEEQKKEIQDRINELEKEQGAEPTIEELAEEAREIHPYYFMGAEIDRLNKQIDDLK